MIEKYLVKKITEPVDWKVTVPGSKSMTNRALLMAVLSAGTVRVEGIVNIGVEVGELILALTTNVTELGIRVEEYVTAATI